MNAPTVACVLMASPEFTADYVVRLYEAVRKYWTGPLDFVALTDTWIGHPEVKEIALEHRFPGTWCKMELFRPDIRGTLLFFDLDTMIIGSLDEIQANDRHTMLRRLKRRDRHNLASGMMLLPEAVRPVIWWQFSKDPARFMELYQFGNSRGRPPGEQGFIEQTWQRYSLGHEARLKGFDYERWNREGIARWQDLYPGQIESYKLHIRRRGAVGKNTRVVLFHGEPRPADIGWKLPKRVAS
jgi:hypothetical protein